MKQKYIKWKSLRNEMDDLMNEIINDHKHGECYYEESDLNDFLVKLNKIKRLAKKRNKWNIKERTEEG